MIGGRHRRNALRRDGVARVFQRVAQRQAEFSRAGFCGAQRRLQRALQHQAGVPGVGGEYRHGVLAIGGFVALRQVHGDGSYGIGGVQLAGHNHRPYGEQGAFGVLAGDAQELAVGDAVGLVDAALIAPFTQGFLRQCARRARRGHQNGIRPRTQQFQCLCGDAGVGLHIAFGGDQLDAGLFGLLARLGQPAIAIGVGKADVAQRLDTVFLHVGKGGGNHQVFVLDHLEHPAPLRIHRLDDLDAGGQTQQRHLFFQRDGHQRQGRRRD
ncbi:hypothetical protein D3C72_1001660 [compost metagenome]